MAKLDKSTVALTFKFDCERFLRYRLATRTEVKSKVVPDAIALRNADRPGIKLITAQGRAWEARCYDDIVKASKGSVAFEPGKYDDEIERKTYDVVKNLDTWLAKSAPPSFIVEAQFNVPGSIGQGLKNALDSGRLEAALGRPDILWIRPFDDKVPLIRAATPSCKYIIHVIDVKLAAEPSLRHFVEVTFYALGLQAWLEEKKLADKYAVSAQGLVWPGTHEASAFASLVSNFEAEGDPDAVAHALEQTVFSVPYEIYKPRLQQFIDERLPEVLQIDAKDAAWHVSKKCQLCEFFRHCKKEARETDALSQITGLTGGQVDVLHRAGLTSTKGLQAAIDGGTKAWATAKAESHALRAQESAIKARIEALAKGKVVPVPGRRTTAMPKFAHLSIFLTAHFDPGTGITFAFGAHKVYFKGDGSPPSTEEVYMLVDKIAAPGNIMSPVTEGKRLIELCTKVRGWLQDLDQANSVALPDDQHHAHFYVWDAMEARQLARVVARHAGNKDVLEQAEFLLRVFPPEGELANPADWKSQPLSIVKPVVRNLLALPVAFEYTLMDSKNWLDPFVKDGEHVMLRHEWGFSTDLSDQIPLERAYEIWQDKPMLTKYHPTEDRAGQKYTQEELREGIKKALKTHLSALRSVVGALGKDYRSQLLLRKESFSLLKAPPKLQLPANSVHVLTMERLNVVAAELENREILAQPIEEREAQFVSMRGIVRTAETNRTKELRAQVSADPRYSPRIDSGKDAVYIFAFSLDSRDTRLREGSFTVVLRDEDSVEPLETKWYTAAGYTSYQDAAAHGLTRNGGSLQHEPLKYLLGANVARIDSLTMPPLLALVIDKERAKFAAKSGIRKMDKAMVLDPIHRDFSGDLIEKAIRRLGGKAK